MSKSKIKKYLIASLILYSAGLVLVSLAALIYFYENATLKQDIVKVITIKETHPLLKIKNVKF